MSENRTYIAIDLKSFFASVECRERGLDPLTTNLVVADTSRTEKTICLAVTPSLKAYGIPGRARLFEVIQKVREVNRARAAALPERRLSGASYFAEEIAKDPTLAVDYLIAPPRMVKYMEYSTRIYDVYLRYIAPEDMHVYSIDEVFMDVTGYLRTYRMSARELARQMIQDVLTETGITATAGIGTNLYLCKIAMDIVAKHVEADADGVRMAELDERSYREQLWSHRPLTDFWRVGRGISRKLEASGLYTMGDVARCSIGGANDFYNEELLYRLFGINAELLIDHAWGYEPCTMAEIKAYRPTTNSLCTGQVLQCAYTADKARIVVREMIDAQVLDLVAKGLVTDQIVLTIGYDVENLLDPARRAAYHGEVTTDRYGRSVPKHAHGTANLGEHSSSTEQIVRAVLELYDRIVNPKLLIRRMNLSVNHLLLERDVPQKERFEQLDLFTDYAALRREREAEEAAKQREKSIQHAMIDIKSKYGKNAILRGTDFCEGATARERNAQIGGHKA